MAEPLTVSVAQVLAELDMPAEATEYVQEVAAAEVGRAITSAHLPELSLAEARRVVDAGRRLAEERKARQEAAADASEAVVDRLHDERAGFLTDGELLKFFGSGAVGHMQPRVQTISPDKPEWDGPIGRDMAENLARARQEPFQQGMRW